MNHEAVMNLLRLTRAYCAEKLVWFSPALFGVRIILTEKVPVAAIDRNMNIYFNPKAVEAMENNAQNLTDFVQQLGFVWIHEIAHVLREHSARADDQKADAKLWNIAADFEINDGIWEGLKMPEIFPGLLPKNYELPDGKVAEWYYYELLDKPQLAIFIGNKGSGIYGQLPDGDVGISNGGSGIHGQLPDWDEGSGVHGQPRNWDEGSGVHGQPRNWEAGENRQKLHPLDLEVMRCDVAQKMHENRKFIGSMPGSWALWVDKILKSRTDWRKKLRHRMSIAISTGIGLQVDYSFARPSRRQSVYLPIVAPAFSGDLSARIACVVDTSGSMGGDELGQAVGEVCGVLADFKIPITVIPCDAAAYAPILVSKPSDYVKLQKLSGGGGTDMIVGIEAALALRPKPDTILVLTDGYTGYPPMPYKTPVVFGILKRDFNAITPLPNMPPWSKEAVVDVLIGV
jgi:predicted metal-dependent peptidase